MRASVAADCGLGAAAGAAEGWAAPELGFAGATVGAVACAGSLAAVFFGWSVSQAALNSTANSRPEATMHLRNFMPARKRLPTKRLRPEGDGTTRRRSESTKRDRTQRDDRSGDGLNSAVAKAVGQTRRSEIL